MKKLFVFSVLLVFALALVPSSTALAAACPRVSCEADSASTATGNPDGCQCGSSALTTPQTKFCAGSIVNPQGGTGRVFADEASCRTALNPTTPAPGTGSSLNIPFVNEGLRGIQTQGGPDTIEKVGTYIGTIGNYMFTFLMAAAVILIIWGAFDFIAGGGDPKRIETARQKIMWAFVGIAIALLAVFFAPIVRSFLGVSIAP